MVIVGIDLAAYPKNISGIAVIENNFIEFSSAFSDEEIIAFIKENSVVVIDAPLTYKFPYRYVDKIFLGKGALPLSSPFMQMLYKRANELTMKIKSKYKNVEILETIVPVIKKQYKVQNVELLEKCLWRFGIKFRNYPKNKHEFDAGLCALVGICYKFNKYEVYGNEEEKVYFPSNIFSK